LKVSIFIFLLGMLAAGLVVAEEKGALFDPSDIGQSTRYSVSLDLENEDSDWSFEVTVTVEF
jgi:hypothetical protein